MIFKTDWAVTDSFDLDPDYIRIKGNIKTIREKALTLYDGFYLPELIEQQVSDIPYEDFFNNIERGVEMIADKTFRRQTMQNGKIYRENQAIWTFEDLNRIESNLQIILTDLMSCEKNRNGLALNLGGVSMGGIVYG